MENRVQKRKRPVVERIFPKPVRKLFRTMNFHFTEHGRVIYHVAKKLPPEEKAKVVEAGKKFCVARSKKNFPRGARNVASSLIVGQGMWYIGCPLLSQIPGIRETPLGWLVWGGSDKLFIASDQIFFHTGGFSSEFASHLAAGSRKTVAFGGAMLAIELATDFSRCWIESWTQKKWGIVADGAARLYGQSRPFPVRYSSFEAYQKIISYILRPWTIGTPQQIFSSIQGFMGSLWRTGPQLLVIGTVGRWVDKFFKKVSEWTGLRKLANRIKESGEKGEKAAMETIEKAIGSDKFLALKYMLAADSKKTWKWNPFKLALSEEKAVEAVRITREFDDVQDMLTKTKIAADSDYRKIKDEFLERLNECVKGITEVFGRRTLARIPEYADLSEMMRAREIFDVEISLMESASDKFSKTLEFLQTERQLA